MYRWAATDRALDAALADGTGPMASLSYTNPLNGAAVVPTLGCSIHRIVPGSRTTTARRTGTSVFIVFAGSGRSVIDGRSFDWRTGDVVTIPSWAAVDH